jgi:uncharacterized membrane protein
MEFIDFLTVFLCTLLYFFLESVWHSSFFLKKKRFGYEGKKKKRWLYIFGGAVASFFLVFFLAFFENYLQVVHFWDGVIAGAIVALGVVLPGHFFLFARGVEKPSLFLLEIFSALVNLMLVGGVLAG